MSADPSPVVLLRISRSRYSPASPQSSASQERAERRSAPAPRQPLPDARRGSGDPRHRAHRRLALLCSWRRSPRSLDEHGDRPVRPPRRALLGSHRALPEAGDRRGQRLRPGRRLRTGDALRPDRRRRVGTVRPAGDQGRGDAGCRRHPAPGTGGGQVPGAAHAVHRLPGEGSASAGHGPGQRSGGGRVDAGARPGTGHGDRPPAPLALAQIKEVVLAGADLPLDSALALERKAFQLLFDSQDQKGRHAGLPGETPAELPGK